MTEEKKDSKRKQQIISKLLKATIKAVIFYGIYFVLSMFLTPISEIVPSFQQTVELFVMVYISLMIIGELTRGTVFQHFFNTAKVFFVMLYLIFSLKRGIINIPFQNISLMIDLRLFMAIAMLLSLLGLAKCMLQAINYLNEKAGEAHFSSL